MPPPFPLLRVPLLPLGSIISNMSVSELIRLQACSKKLYERLKATRKSVSFHSISENQRKKLTILEKLDLLRIEIYNNRSGSSGCFKPNYFTIIIKVTAVDGIKVEINNNNNHIASKYQSCFPFSFHFDFERIDHEFVRSKRSFEIDGITVPVVLMEKKEFHTFWKDQSDGLNISINYWKNFFNTQNIEYSIYGSNHTMFSQNLRAVVKEMAEQTISNCKIWTEIPKIDDYKFILDNIKPTICFEHLHDFSHQSYSCRLDTNFTFTSKYLKLELADWFTFDNLCSTDCEEIILKCTELNSVDMIKYVKLWMNGKFPKLKRLDVEVYKTVSLGSFLSELQGYEKKLRYTIDKVVDTIQIKRQNHTIATISNKPTPYSQISFEFHILENPFNN